MEFKTTSRFEESFKNIPKEIRKKFYKQVHLLTKDIKYPSLHCKKIQGVEGIWEARVDYKYRFTFIIQTGVIILRVIGNHDEVLNNP